MSHAHEGEWDPDTSPSQVLGELRFHPGWTILRARVAKEVEQIRMQLSGGAATPNLETVRRLQGIIEGMERVLEMPENVIKSPGRRPHHRAS